MRISLALSIHSVPKHNAEATDASAWGRRYKNEATFVKPCEGKLIRGRAEQAPTVTRDCSERVSGSGAGFRVGSGRSQEGPQTARGWTAAPGGASPFLAGAPGGTNAWSPGGPAGGRGSGPPAARRPPPLSADAGPAFRPGLSFRRLRVSSCRLCSLSVLSFDKPSLFLLRNGHLV